jgi:hypothetical protein
MFSILKKDFAILQKGDDFHLTIFCLPSMTLKPLRRSLDVAVNYSHRQIVKTGRFKVIEQPIVIER